MLKVLILILIFLSTINAGVNPRVNTIIEITDSNYCYTRKLLTDSITHYTDNYCGSVIEMSPSSTTIYADKCSGAQIGTRGDVQYHQLRYSLSKELCTDINQELDLDNNSIYYKDGIPYDTTTVENGSYYNNYDDILICNSSYLQVNNESCIQPDYNKRNIADALIKRDKIVTENGLVNASSILAENIVYNSETGAIESFTFTATNLTTGAIEVINTSFTEDDKVYTVEEDGTITESEYSSSNDTTSTVSSNDMNSLISLTHSTNSIVSEIYHESIQTSKNTKNTTTSINQSNTLLSRIEHDLNQINNSFHPANSPVVDNPLDNVEETYDTDIIPKIEEFVENFTNDITVLKDTYTEKVEYIESNGFEFNYSTKLYNTCALNYELDVFDEFFDESLVLNFDVCSIMANSQIPNTELTVLTLFNTIFYTFFYSVILIGIFQFATLTLRSF